jgi:hypothetical protein
MLSWQSYGGPYTCTLVHVLACNLKVSLVTATCRLVKRGWGTDGEEGETSYAT